jgi:hypothetical protein
MNKKVTVSQQQIDIYYFKTKGIMLMLSANLFKRNLTRDFQLQVFFKNRFCPGHLEFLRKLAEIFEI